MFDNENDREEKNMASDNNLNQGYTDDNPQYRYARYKEVNRINLDHIPEEPKKKERKGGFVGALKKILVACFCGLFFGLFAGTAFYGISYLSEKYGNKEEASVEESKEIADNADDNKEIPDKLIPPVPEITNFNPSDSSAQSSMAVMDASSVVESCMPSIVSITSNYVQTFQNFWGQKQQYESEASGSGIIVGENETELLIVTNSHVISDATGLTVEFSDGKTADAMVKGANSDSDIAIIAVSLSDLSDETKSKISIATLGDSDSLKVGEPAIAIGNSLGYGQSVTSGIISAVDRDFTVDNNSHKVIQTDAAINPGNSGGALLNIRGEVIGINEAKYSETSVEGVGYAIPISIAKPIIDELATKTTRAKVDEKEAGYLGISGVDVTEEVSKTYDMPIGVYIAMVTDGSAADEAGLVKGDVIVEFDGETVSSMDELKDAISYYPAGEEIEIKYRHMGDNGYEEKTAKVTLGRKPE